MKHWLTKKLMEKIKIVFEPKYKKELSEKEIIEIANNLTKSMELIIKNKIENGV